MSGHADPFKAVIRPVNSVAPESSVASKRRAFLIN